MRLAPDGPTDGDLAILCRRFRARPWRRCTPPGSGTATCPMTRPQSPWRITGRTGRPRPLRGRACRRRRMCRGRSASSPTARANRRCMHRAHIDGGKRRHRRAVCPARWGVEHRRGQPCLTFRADWAGFHGRPWRGTVQPSLRGGGRSAPPAAPLTQAPQGLRQGLGTLESRENTVLSPHPTGVATEC